MTAKVLAALFVTMIMSGASSSELVAPPTIDEIEGVFQLTGAAPVCLAAGAPVFATPANSVVVPPACAYINEPPCSSLGDCGYVWDGVCCNPRCPGRFCESLCSS